jgi:elongation of very long chain fatty acids protein 6
MSSETIANQFLNDKSLLHANISYPFLLDFERKFDSPDYVGSLRNWMNTNWTNSIMYALIYILIIFGGKAYMANRDRFELRGILAVWNMILAIFSIVGTFRLMPEMYHALSNHGFEYSICNNSYAYGVTGFWTFLFVMSKLVELVDTVFIVLRKQQLIFLHWYHHATVLVYCWYSYHDHSSSGRWFACMNYFVHSIMYTYYALKALRFNVSKHVSKLITTLQLLQMVFGCLINYHAWLIKTNKTSECSISFENIKYSFIMYLTYFVLFFNFFISSYILNKQNPKLKKK